MRIEDTHLVGIDLIPLGGVDMDERKKSAIILSLQLLGCITLFVVLSYVFGWLIR